MSLQHENCATSQNDICEPSCKSETPENHEIGGNADSAETETCNNFSIKKSDNDAGTTSNAINDFRKDDKKITHTKDKEYCSRSTDKHEILNDNNCNTRQYIIHESKLAKTAIKSNSGNESATLQNLASKEMDGDVNYHSGEDKTGHHQKFQKIIQLQDYKKGDDSNQRNVGHGRNLSSTTKKINHDVGDHTGPDKQIYHQNTQKNIHLQHHKAEEETGQKTVDQDNGRYQDSTFKGIDSNIQDHIAKDKKGYHLHQKSPIAKIIS